MIYQGHVRNGIIVLEGSPQLPEGAAVIVTPVKVEAAQPFQGQTPETADGLHDPLMQYSAVVDAEETADEQDDPLLRILDLAVETGIPDLSINIDHYLYGHPKILNDKNE